MIADLYLEAEDYRLAYNYFRWFDKNFPDDATYAFFQLGAARTFFEQNKRGEAGRRIVRVNACNVYLVDVILGNELRELGVSEFSPSEGLAYVLEHEDSYLKLVSMEFKEWLEGFSSTEPYRSYYGEYVSILQALRVATALEERRALLDAKRGFLEKWMGCYG